MNLENWSLAEAQDVVAVALSDVALRVVPPGSRAPEGVMIDIGDGNMYAADRSEDAWQRVVIAARQRTSVGRDRLADVAQLYKVGGVNAVAANLTISKSQAYRLLAQARKQGMIGS